jgi:hypothetical protein
MRRLKKPPGHQGAKKKALFSAGSFVSWRLGGLKIELFSGRE